MIDQCSASAVTHVAWEEAWGIVGAEEAVRFSVELSEAVDTEFEEVSHGWYSVS